MSGVTDGAALNAFAFDRWTLHVDGRLTGNALDTQLPPKEWHVLRLLLASPGVLVTKDRLLELAWPHNDATEESLTRCVYSLRKHLKDGGKVIKTVYGKGYRVSCPVVIFTQDTRGKLERSTHVCAACGWVNDPES